MIKALCAVAVAGLAISPVSGAMVARQQDQMWMHLDGADEILKEKGYAATKWKHLGELEQRGETSFDITLAGGSTYAVVGVCLSSCTDLDIYVRDASGNLVGSDVADDSFPMVGVDRGGVYSVRVVMKACSPGPCAFGVKTYRK